MVAHPALVPSRALCKMIRIKNGYVPKKVVKVGPLEHTCADWNPSEMDDPFENPPTLWCPACMQADAIDHRRRSQQLIVDAYMAEYHPGLQFRIGQGHVQPVEGVAPACMKNIIQATSAPLRLTELQASALKAGGVLAEMTRDSICKNMKPFWYYCEKDDPTWLDPKPCAPLAPAAPKTTEPSEPVKVPTFKVKGDAAKRQQEYSAWISVPRNKRSAYFDGHTIKASCLPKDNSIVLKNLPLDSPTLEGDMRELVALVAPVVDIYRPRSGGMFIGLLKYEHVDMVLDAYKDGVLYRGCHVRFEAALSKSKTAQHFAASAAIGPIGPTTAAPAAATAAQ